MNVGTLYAQLVLATGAFDQGLTSAGARLRSFGAQVTQAGRDIMVMTAPLAAVGAGAVQTGMKFETSFARIEGLVGITGRDLEMLKTRVLALAGQTAKSPTELAEALYYLTSSGMSAAEAAEVLEVAAKGSTVGLGTTQVVAKAAAFAINAYRDTGLDAATATDILTAAVKYGTIEADEMAPVLGRLLPIASDLGISYNQVAGTLAVMSRTGLDAAEAATSMSSIFSNMIKPSEAARKVLASVGLSMAELREVAAREPDGVIQVYRLLSDTLTEEQFSVVVPNVRALRGAMNFLAQETESVDEVMRGVADSSGSLDKALDVINDTAEYQLNQTMADLQLGLLELWDTIRGPLIAALKDASNFIKDLVTKFKNMDEGTKETIVKIGALFVALGPLLIIFGTMIKVIGTLTTGLGSLVGGFGNVIKGVGSMIGSFAGLVKTTGGVIPALKSLAVSGITALLNPLVLVTVAAGALIVSVIGLMHAVDNGRKAAKDYVDQWEIANGVIEDATDAHKALADGAQELHDKYSPFKQDLVGSIALMIPFISSIKGAELSQGELAAQTELVRLTEEKLQEARIRDSNEEIVERNERFIEQYKRQREVLESMPDAFDMNTEAAERLAEQFGGTAATWEATWQAIQRDAEKASENVRAALELLPPDMELTEEAAAELASQFGLSTGEIIAMWQEMNPIISESTADLNDALGDVSLKAEKAWMDFQAAPQRSIEDVMARIEVLRGRLREFEATDIASIGPSARDAWYFARASTEAELGELTEYIETKGEVIEDAVVEVEETIEASVTDITGALGSMAVDSDKEFKKFIKSFEKGNFDSQAEIDKLTERLRILREVDLTKLSPAALAEWTGLYNATQTSLDRTTSFVEDKGTILDDLIPDALDRANTDAQEEWDALMGITDETGDEVVDAAEADAADLGDAMPDGLSDAAPDLGRELDNLEDDVATSTENAADEAADQAADAGAAMPAGFRDNMQALGTALDAVFRTLQTVFQSFATMAGAWGWKIGDSWVSQIAAAIRNGQGAVNAAARNALSGLEGHSPPRVGPLKDIDEWARKVAMAWVLPFQQTIRDSGILAHILPDGTMARVNASAMPQLAPVAQSQAAVRDRMGIPPIQQTIYGMQPGDVERETKTAVRRIALEWELE